MSVYIETSAGDVVVDLFTDECPQACQNFLKLCKLKYYHNCMFFKVTRNFIAQSGDPGNDGSGGTSIFGLLNGPSQRCFKDELLPTLKHVRAGMLGMATGKPNSNASQFYFTLTADLDVRFHLPSRLSDNSLDMKHTLFGEIAEDEDGMIEKLNASIVDERERPLQNIRIRRTEILDDPFPDPDGLASLIPERSPDAVYEFGDRLEEDWKPEEDRRTEAEIEADLEAQKAKNRKILLEMIGDRPHAEAKAPEEFLFVCKLNPVTTEEDLETIFSRFGEIIACDIIKDKKTGDSLNYAFIGFTEKKSAEEAYLKMNNALIDDRRIKVDFSQSMHHQWKEYRKLNVERGPKQKHPGRPGEGILLAGGKFKLKSGAHGQGVGTSLGLMGHGQGHGQSRNIGNNPAEVHSSWDEKEHQSSRHDRKQSENSSDCRGGRRQDPRSDCDRHSPEMPLGRSRRSPHSGDRRSHFSNSQERSRFRHGERDRHHRWQDRSRERRT